jgi:hypothetical protein
MVPFSLTPERETQNQGLGQSRLRHALLHRFNIIRDTPELHRLTIEVGNREGGARVAVARLARRTRDSADNSFLFQSAGW